MSFSPSDVELFALNRSERLGTERKDSKLNGRAQDRSKGLGKEELRAQQKGSELNGKVRKSSESNGKAQNRTERLGAERNRTARLGHEWKGSDTNGKARFQLPSCPAPFGSVRRAITIYYILKP